MSLFKIAQGPWKQLVKGSVQDSELEVYVNPEKMLFVQILQQENGQVTGAVCEFYKTYVAEGNVGSFVQTLPRDLLVLTRHAKDQTNTFLLLGSSPVSVVWDENVFLEQSDILLKKLEVGSSLIKDVGRAYDVVLKSMNECPPEVANSFFTLPLLYPILATNAIPQVDMTGKQPESAAAHMGALPGEFVLGVTPGGLMVKEPVIFFKKTGVFNARVEHRKHVLQVIVEGMLFSNVPVVIVDWENEFSSMRNPNPNPTKLHEQKIEGDPIGFPLKEFVPPENLKMELSMIFPEGLVELLGIANNDLGKNLVHFLHEHKVSTIDEAIGILRQLPPSETFTPFQIASISRLFRLLDQTYPSMFNGINPTEEISKSWFQSLGRVGVLRMKELPIEWKRLLIGSILHGIYELYERKGVSGRVKSMVVIPEAEQLFDYTKQPLLSRELERILGESGTQDVGFIVSSAHEIDLPKGMLNLLEARLNLIGGTEAGVTLAGRKNYRVSIRDTYSMPVVKDFFALK